MQRRRPVVVGYDGSGRADVALRWGVREAAMRGLPLRIVTAVPPVAGGEPRRAAGLTPDAAAARVVLDRGRVLASTLGVASELSASVVTGPPAGVLSHESLGAELVVVGQRHQDRPVSSALGSVAVVLAAHSTCPVVVARGAAGDERAGLPVVVGMADDAACRETLAAAAVAARVRGVPLSIVTSWAVPGARHPRTAADDLARFSRRLEDRAVRANQEARDWVRRRHPQLECRSAVQHRAAVGCLAEASRGAGLVVVGSLAAGHRTTDVGSMRLGAVATGILGWSTCPVLVVPEPSPTLLAGRADHRTHTAVRVRSSR